MGNFQPLEIMGSGSLTQLQVGENLNYLIWRFNNGFTLSMSHAIYR